MAAAPDPMQSEWVIRHLPGSEPPRFAVQGSPGPDARPRTLPAADAFPVEGRPASHLMAELCWYLESFLDYPFSPETERAERILAALRQWGEQAFGSLFGPTTTFADAGALHPPRERRPPDPLLALGGPPRPPGRSPRSKGATRKVSSRGRRSSPSPFSRARERSPPHPPGHRAARGRRDLSLDLAAAGRARDRETTAGRDPRLAAADPGTAS